MNWLVIFPVGIAVVVLIIFLLWRNQKDEKKVEEQLKEDFPKSKNEEGDTEIDEVMK